MLKKKKFCRENIVNRSSNSWKTIFLCFTACIGVISNAWQRVRMVGSLAKQCQAKPTPSVSVLPCDTFTFAWWIYDTGRMEVPLHAKCEFFWTITSFSSNLWGSLEEFPIRKSQEKKTWFSLQCGSTVKLPHISYLYAKFWKDWKGSE